MWEMKRVKQIIFGCLDCRALELNTDIPLALTNHLYLFLFLFFFRGETTNDILLGVLLIALG